MEKRTGIRIFSLIVSLLLMIIPLILSSCSASLFQNERIDLSEASETDKTEEGLPAFQGGAESWTELMDLMRQYHKIILPLPVLTTQSLASRP